MEQTRSLECPHRFISRSTDKGILFYQLLRKNRKFEWTEGSDKAFQELKDYLSSPPIMTKPMPGEPIYIYVVVSDEAISGVLVWEDKRKQRLVSYISRKLLDADKRYLQVEKLALAVFKASTKLRHQFQVHTIVVVTERPIHSIIHSPNQSGRITKWSIRLGAYDVDYRMQIFLKSQVFEDFLIKLPMEATELSNEVETWKLKVDRSAMSQGSGIGIRLVSPMRDVVEKAVGSDTVPPAMRLSTKLSSSPCNQPSRSEYSAYTCKNMSDMTRGWKPTPTWSKPLQEGRLLQPYPADEGRQHLRDALAKLRSTTEANTHRTITVETVERPSIPREEGPKKKKVKVSGMEQEERMTTPTSMISRESTIGRKSKVW